MSTPEGAFRFSGSCKARWKIPELVEALQGEFTQHHAFMVRPYHDQVDHLSTLAEAFDLQIARALADQQQDLVRLDTIAGVGRLAAEVILAEAGGDMDRFASAQHLASWIGVCPGQNSPPESTNPAAHDPATPTSSGCSAPPPWPRSATRTPALSVFYRRIAARRGGKRALVAVMHKLAIAIWHVLHDQQPFHDLRPITSPTAPYAA